MATPPRVTDDRAAQAVRDIAARRAAIDDPHREQLGDGALETLSYLRKHSGPDIPEDIRKRDIDDALILRVWLWWRLAGDELWILDQAEDLGMSRRRVGRPFGISTTQGVNDRRDRLRAMLSGHGRPEEKVMRAQRANAHARASQAERRQRWLTRHRRAIRDVASALVAYQDLADDEAAEWLIEVAHDLAEDACTPATFTVASYAAGAMTAVCADLGLPDDHSLQQALRGWQSLAVQYARIRE